MVYLCFSSHIRVINIVCKQCSALFYSIENCLPYYVIKKRVLWYIKQIIIIGYCPAVYLIFKPIKRLEN